MTRRHVLPLLLALHALTGCGFGDDRDPGTPDVAFAGEPAPSDSVWSRGYSAAAPDASGLEQDLHGRYTVPPDRALVRVDATAQSATRDGVTRRIRRASQELVTALSVEGVCEVSVVDLGAPRRAGDRWYDTATLRIDVPLAGFGEVEERFVRVERCMERFGAMGASVADLELAVSHPLPTLDRPDAHRAALLERAMRPLQEVATTDGPAAFDADGMRCVSRGEVTITERSLHGIALAVDLACTPRTGPLAQAPAAPELATL
ncbi:MAG: hypothetical protein H6719_07715 [Sandaracinaceae bacterium]|nr:hypothetical protein [Sandaracinaceae bacterium]